MEQNMTTEEMKMAVYKYLPRVLKEHPDVRCIIEDMLSSVFASKSQTEDRFEKILKEIQDQRAETDRRFEEHDRRFEELRERADRKHEQLLKQIERVDRRIDRTIGALGARWGLSSEHSFREAIKAVITELTDLKVERYLSYDNEGMVFGHPDQVEIDVVIRNGDLWLIEIKSSMSKADVYVFEKKARFYEKEKGKKADRLMIVSPMVAPNAFDEAKRLEIEVYSAPEDIEDISRYRV